jgi:hypothetical protein
VSNRDFEYITSRTGIREPGRVVLHSEINIFTTEAKVAVSNKCSRQQATLGQNLKTIADADHDAAGMGEPNHFIHNG